MKVATLNFGELEITKEDIFTFKQGLPGFEDLREFVLIQPDPNVPFSYLQSVNQGEISMIVTSPFLFYPEYDLEVTEQVLQDLKIEQESDVFIWTTISIKDEIQTATINLLAPIVMNVKQKLGRQMILHDSQYQTKHKLIADNIDKPIHSKKREVK